MTSTYADKQSIEKEVYIDESRVSATTVGNIEKEFITIYYNKEQQELFGQINYFDKKRKAFYSKVNDILGGD